jgi:hypothetical protein
MSHPIDQAIWDSLLACGEKLNEEYPDLTVKVFLTTFLSLVTYQLYFACPSIEDAETAIGFALLRGKDGYIENKDKYPGVSIWESK